MRKGKEKFTWSYLIEPEDSTTPARCFAAETAKTCLWICMSFFMAAGISQLT
ncbi:hypothetical protein [Pseudodesulfovibrio sp. zrk46]|uniref:hypothetical protein n=1 Tax=Pseudodesulfovibrio sp. zrk46 TaxID=2725288 RepID=UPI001449DB4F|nr:hypothetical protein [Pseudodesulfovibrio sp. zrk46]QJB55980.1 hypothetical protein HFN16_05950 [Pseudodesulfovibrio sp. zrk46]